MGSVRYGTVQGEGMLYRGSGRGGREGEIRSSRWGGGAVGGEEEGQQLFSVLF
jgi:hypothetical protein